MKQLTENERTKLHERAEAARIHPKLVRRMLESAFYEGYGMGKEHGWFTTGIPAAVVGFAIGFLARGLFL